MVRYGENSIGIFDLRVPSGPYRFIAFVGITGLNGYSVGFLKNNE